MVKLLLSSSSLMCSRLSWMSVLLSSRSAESILLHFSYQSTLLKTVESLLHGVLFSSKLVILSSIIFITWFSVERPFLVPHCSFGRIRCRSSFSFILLKMMLVIILLVWLRRLLVCSCAVVPGFSNILIFVYFHLFRSSSMSWNSFLIVLSEYPFGSSMSFLFVIRSSFSAAFVLNPPIISYISSVVVAPICSSLCCGRGSRAL